MIAGLLPQPGPKAVALHHAGARRNVVVTAAAGDAAAAPQPLSAGLGQFKVPLYILLWCVPASGTGPAPSYAPAHACGRQHPWCTHGRERTDSHSLRTALGAFLPPSGMPSTSCSTS